MKEFICFEFSIQDKESDENASYNAQKILSRKDSSFSSPILDDAFICSHKDALCHAKCIQTFQWTLIGNHKKKKRRRK
jgi:hypothetical protein